MEYKFSLYDSVKSKEASDLTIDNYIGYVKHGAYQDIVLKARALKQQGKEEQYKELKSKAKVITGSCVYETGKAKLAENIKAMNNLIVIDIDEKITDERYYELKNDKYTMVIHRSFGGDGFCIFVKIDSQKFNESFLGLSEYYFQTYNVTIDQACKNKNRLRYISYDPEIHHNPKSHKFVPKNVKKFAPPKETNYIFHQDDFDNILLQIDQQNIDLCQEDYFRYVRIGMAIADKFGSAGLDKFHFICSKGGKYDAKRTEKDYNGFVRNNNHECKIGTFYYYCKDAGIDIYSEKTKTIINRVKVAKSQGTPTAESIISNLKVANGIEANDEDIDLILRLIQDKTDYSKEANKDLTEIEQVQKFIIDTYNPYLDEISNYIYINDNVMEDKELNDIYINCKKSFDFKVPMTDILSILNSNQIRKVNNLNTFIQSNNSTTTGVIEEYAKCVYPQSEYNVWAFKKWIVGAIHNWLADKNEVLVCPLTLVLSGQEHGTGKTSFFRNILPQELKKYFTQEKINSKDKDSMYRLCSSLIIFDDEFGGEGFKDVKAFKSLSDQNTVTQRRPFAKQDSIFKRRAILCGTTNEIDILKDVTGNRRILPINVERIDYDKMLQINKTDLIMEAYNLYKSGFEWIVRKEEDIDYIAENTKDNTVVLPIEEVFFNHFSIEKRHEYDQEKVMNQGEILEYLNTHSILKPNKYDLKEVLVKNKLTYKLYNVGGNYKKGIKLFLTDPNFKAETPF